MSDTSGSHTQPTTRATLAASLRMLALCAVAAIGVGAWASTAQAEERGSAPDPSTQSEETLFQLDSAIGDIEYRLGRGLHLGRTGLNLGGFKTFEAAVENDGSYELELDTNVLAIYQPISQFRALAEIELGEILAVEDGTAESGIELGAERLYADLLLDDPVNFRFGKFLTPVGRWNQVPLEPFLWTSAEPFGVEVGFDNTQTGAMLFGSFFPSSRVLTYNLYTQFLGPLDEDGEPTDHSAGARVEYGDSRERWAVGASFLASERDRDWNFLGGIDGQLRFGRLELSTEALYTDGDFEKPQLWDVYVQAVFEVCPTFFVIGRYEHFSPLGPEPSNNIGDFAIAWQPWSFLNVKAGYRLAEREEGDEVLRGFNASISLLF